MNVVSNQPLGNNTADITRFGEFANSLIRVYHDLLDRGAPPEKLKIYVTPRVKRLLAPNSDYCFIGDHRLPIFARTDFPEKELEDGVWASDIVIGNPEEWDEEKEEWVDV